MKYIFHFGYYKCINIHSLIMRFAISWFANSSVSYFFTVISFPYIQKIKKKENCRIKLFIFIFGANGSTSFILFRLQLNSFLPTLSSWSSNGPWSIDTSRFLDLLYTSQFLSYNPQIVFLLSFQSFLPSQLLLPYLLSDLFWLTRLLL